MREIKFRAWHRREKRMLSWREVSEYYLGDMAKQDYADLMQYTGLKDKNGKEIYEGDILTHPYRPDEFIVMTLDPYKIHQLIEFGEWDMLGHSEIIGNIYENPDLLAKN